MKSCVIERLSNKEKCLVIEIVKGDLKRTGNV